jgi:hypothetical protein
MSGQLEFKKIREFSEIINDTFIFVKQNLRPLLKVYVYLCGFFLLATMISAIIYQTGVQKVMLNPGSARSMAALTSMFSFQYLFLIIFGLANFTAVNVSVLSYIAIYIEKGNIAPTVEEVWAYFKYYFFRAAGSSVVAGLFIMVCFICCVIPGIYVFPAMSLFFPVMILENGSLTYSFGRSFKLLKDNWGTTAGAIFIMWIITYASTSAASLPAIILTLFGVFTSATHTVNMTTVIISTVIQYLCQVFMVLPLIAASLCYFNLVERHENTGLMNRLNHLGETKEDPGTKEEY